LPLIFKSAERNHSYHCPGTGKTTIIDGLIAKGHCCYPEISEVTAEAKKERSIVLENRCFSVSYLKAEKNSFKTHTKSHMKLYLLTRNSDVLLTCTTLAIAIQRL
jgi:hypothetical protein